MRASRAGHVAQDELIDCASGLAGARAQRHLDGCAACRARVDELRAELESLQAVEVPEPSALYWQTFRRQVARRLEQEVQPRRRWAAWLWLPALAGAAALVLALVPYTAWRGPAPVTLTPAAFVPAWTPLPEAGEDTGLDVLRALASTGAMAAVSECQGLDECLAELPDDEAQHLAQVFRAELEGGEL